MDENQRVKATALSDTQLLERINGGEYELFSVLIDRAMPHIVSAATAQKSIVPDTEDLIGEGVFAVFSAVRSFDGEKSSFKTFSNLCVDRAINARVKAALAAKRIPNSMVSSLDGVEVAVDETPENLLIKKEDEDNFDLILKTSLTELERNVLSLFLSGDSYAQISDKLSLSKKSVDSAMQRVRKKLKR